MKNQSLLRRYRWPLFILLWGAGQLCGTAYLYHDKQVAMYGFIAVIVLGCVAVVLNSIDEQTERSNLKR